MKSIILWLVLLILTSCSRGRQTVVACDVSGTIEHASSEEFRVKSSEPITPRSNSIEKDKSGEINPQPFSRIKFLNSVCEFRLPSICRLKDIADKYMKDFELKVERTESLDYQKIAIINSMSGSLMMDIGILPNGYIHSIKIINSSCSKALDTAAVEIVKDSAPFQAIPKQLLEELDVLVIRKTWGF